MQKQTIPINCRQIKQNVYKIILSYILVLQFNSLHSTLIK